MAASFRAAVKRYLKAADQARTQAAKGKAFEELTCYLFGCIPGISIFRRNVLNYFESEEIDIAFWNEQDPKGLKSLDATLLVECKNWSTTVGSAEVTSFIAKLRKRSPALSNASPVGPSRPEAKTLATPPGVNRSTVLGAGPLLTAT